MQKRRRRLIAKLIVGAMVTLAVAVVAGSAAGQSPHADAGPKFVLASSGNRGEIPLDVSRTPALKRRISLDLRAATIKDALVEVVKESGLALFYSDDVLPAESRVSLRADNLTVAAALTDILADANVDIVFNENGKAALRKRPPPRKVGSVGGLVTDSASGLPVSGVRLRVEGTSLGTNTDDQGRYRIGGVSEGAHTISARRLGYAVQTRSVSVGTDQEAVVNFTLTRVATALEEVVTTVTGNQRRAEVGNAIGRIDADSVVREGPITSLSDLLNARVSGLQVVQQGGYTGSSPRIRIRGINSISLSNDPLLIVDGVRVENSVTVNAGFGFASGRFNDLNPHEIESVEVLKGPSAATLYGTDAANGVIVVTTKRGYAGSPRWDAYAEMGAIDQPGRFPDTYYGWGRNRVTGAAQQCPLVQVAAGRCVIDSVTTFNPLMNDETTIIGRGNRTQYGLEVSGGTNRFTYFLSGGREDETGYLRMPPIEAARVSKERGDVAVPHDQLHPNGLSRTSLRSNATASFAEKGEVSLSLGYISAQTRIPSATIFSAANLGRGYRDAQNGWGSPLPGEAFAMGNAEEVTRYTTGLSGKWRPRSWLTSRATFGLDYSSASLDGLQRRGEGFLGSGREGRRTTTRTEVWQQTADVGASAHAGLTPRLTARTSVGLQYNRRRQQAISGSGTRLSPGSVTFDGAAVQTVSEQNAETIVAGLYIEEALGFDERLFLTGALRADGGSAFGRDFKTALYPKASLSWIAVNGRSGVLHTLRFRAAYGASGVMPPATAAIQQIALAPTQVNGVITTGAVLGEIGNPDLKPERQMEAEAGVDADIFADRVRVEATYYNRLSRDALVVRPLPSELGVSSRLENIGAVRNRGLEGLVTVRAIDNAAVRWELSANGSQNWSRVEKLGPNLRQLGFQSALSRVGYPLFSQFARPILGYSDANGNGIIESAEVQVGDSLVYVGPNLPPRQLTIGTSLSIPRARLRLSTQFDRRSGFVVTNTQLTVRCSTAMSSCRAAADPTAPLADQASAVARNLPSPTVYGFIENGSFVRWRELSLTYDIPAAPARLVRARNASFTLTGRNLALLTAFRGADPEGGAASPGFEGYNQGAGAPPARHWIARLNLSY